MKWTEQQTVLKTDDENAKLNFVTKKMFFFHRNDSIERTVFKGLCISTDCTHATTSLTMHHWAIFFTSSLWRAFHLCSLFMFRRVSLSLYFTASHSNCTEILLSQVPSTEHRAAEAHRIESRIERLLNEFIVLHMNRKTEHFVNVMKGQLIKRTNIFSTLITGIRLREHNYYLVMQEK